MSHHRSTVRWRRREGEAFADGRYSRVHAWRFDGGAEIGASASPDVVPPPFSSAELVDPEEAFVASLSSCHMLWYLSIAAKRGFVVDAYEDDAEGTMARDGRGRMSITRVVLTPRVAYAGLAPDRATEEAMHHEAHERCFIANSVRTEIEVRVP
ncbi:MAG TPA: OsmC family protein [Azospirillaceae bacterium]|nr:OsmC family protein [Azospirillaceae bacterium]